MGRRGAKFKIGSEIWDRAALVRPEAKQGIYIRLDADVLRWFRKQGRGYQSMINAVLSSFVEAQSVSSSQQVAANPKLRRAQDLFEKFYARCFWHFDRNLVVSELNLPLVIEGLRKYGGREGYIMAEELCH